ncbi:hypothetical protein [Nocardia sp. NPDC004750]
MACPGCSIPSRRLHRHYRRRLADTAIAGREVVIVLRGSGRNAGIHRRCGLLSLSVSATSEGPCSMPTITNEER